MLLRPASQGGKHGSWEAKTGAATGGLCDEYGLQPSQVYRFYRWQAALFEHGVDVFDLKKSRRAQAAESAKDAQIARLEAVVAQKEANSRVGST